MPESKRPLKVFLCHAHADRDPVRGLYTHLTKDGVDAWLDKAKLLPGQDWELEIRKAVREADVVVVCLSKQFNQAGFRQKEVRLALDTAMEKPEGEIFIIPARLEECDNLESLRRWHWVDLFEDDGYEMLVRALRARAGRIGATLQVSSNANKLKRAPDEEEIDRENAEKAEQERKRKLAKLLKENDRRLEAAKRKHKWDMFFLNIRRRLRLFFVNFRFKFLPILFVLIAIGTFVFMIFYLQKIMPELSVDLNPTSQPIQILTETFVPTKAVTVSPSLIESFTPEATSLPTEITDAKGVSIVLVPEGKFIAGVKEQEREVSLEAFYIDQYEVTNSRYAECVSAGSCIPPAETVLASYNYYGNSQYDDYPVVWVNITMAKEYCSWRGGRLPSGLEWEKAARGTDGRVYPWGNDIDSTRRANSFGSKDGYEIASPVGSFPDGVSPYGAYDMAGNVWEWTNDITSFGGSWVYGDLFVYDYYNIGGSARFDFGFRCAKDIF